ncbi:TPR-like protein [Hygrophoropsis aurantiaca]|uniref:TPR-like protein n=1 Tax=Hygrophoropsis aurantiaca TaxID=72124 RepID=A0ACB8ARE6_9AGAM|nr:TPR-like protein [Hygrophoropsis aurantiaca]
MSVTTALSQLANYRAHNIRASQRTFENGYRVLQKNAYQNLGDEEWTFLEQLALASIDVGRLEVADQCLQLLSEKFPDSPRVECLTGIRMEASSSPEIALKYYSELLEADSANAAIWKRKISVLRRTGKTEKTVSELCAFLDTFYTDVEGWLELGDLYAESCQYTLSLQALSHALLLAPQNPFYALQFAETAYTAGDIPLALKTFLMVVDMSDGDDSGISLAESTPLGITVRAWFGVKLCTRRLLGPSPQVQPSASGTSSPTSNNVALLDELATERLRVAYSSSAGVKGEIARGREEVFAWVA